MMKSIPLGIEDYRVLRKKCYYVDKTLLLKDIEEAPESSVFLFARPRRFGKSLALSMIDTFYRQSQEDPSVYFQGTKIYSCPALLAAMGAYPVIHLSFKSISEVEEEKIYALIIAELKREYSRYIDEIVLSEKISDSEKEIAKKDAIGTASYAEYEDSLRLYLLLLHKIRGKKVVVLIDEYDAPMIASYEVGKDNLITYFLRSFYTAALKGNEDLEKGVLSGVLRLSKESLFSGLNNLRVHDVLSPSFSEYFGFTEEEVKMLLSYYGKLEDFDQVKRWYGGYKIGKEEIYNPWSVLSYLDSGEFSPYWVNTSSNTILEKSLENENLSTLNQLTNLLNGDKVLAEIRSSLAYIDVKENNSTLFSLLVNSGYLTIGEKLDNSLYEIVIPNEEIKSVFKNEITSRYANQTNFETLYHLKLALIKGDETLIEKTLEDSILRSLSYYEFGDEKSYQVLVLVLTTILFSSHTVKSEVNTGNGRCDIMVIPKEKGKTGMVIEIKSYNSTLSDAQLKARATTALSQIKKQNYAETLKLEEAKPILLYGFAFSKKKIRVEKEIL